MNFDYNGWLRDGLNALKEDMGLSGFDIEVDEEQSFIKKKDLKPNVIYVLTRALQNSISIGVDTQPIQVLVLTEQNSLETSMALFSQFAKTWNFVPLTIGNIWVKQQYSEPVVLSNFNTVSYGYRSVLYMSVTLYIMENVVDLKDLYIDGNPYTVLSFDIAYQMNPNTQQIVGENQFISRSVKSVSSLAISIALPVTANDLITKVLAILDETDSTTTDPSGDGYTGDPTSYGGNENFYFTFKLGTKQFTNKRMKLISADFGASVNDVPAIKLGFLR